MPRITMPVPQRPAAARRTITSRASFSDDEDAITPCSSPPPEPQDLISQVAGPQQVQASPRFTPSGRVGSTTTTSAAPTTHSRKTSCVTTAAAAQAWRLDPTDGEDMDDSQLWQRMLEIQRVFRCYNSARMSAALLELEMGADAGYLAPSRSCLDLMNESVPDLPEEEKQRLADWLHENSPKTKRGGL